MSVWLAIDTATDTAGVALHDGVRVLGETTWTSRRRHTVQLAPTLDRMLRGHGLAVSELAGIGVAIGPGSYTGLRIGLSLAKGLALGAELPLVGVPTLDTLAAALSRPHVPRDVPLVAVLQAGRGRVVAARYPPGVDDDGWPDPEALEVETVEALAGRIRPPAWLAGELDAAARERLLAAGLTVLPPAACLRRPGWLAALARTRRAQAALGAAALAGVGLVYTR